ncbi:alpha/beta fold hydrolase [Nostocoides sp. F2B08]|uniref:alpha/beta fold hydrolase n=1 Tax=Nostocoides sp. F2B08 TaxID=2653936 RepID=UPI001D051E0C|nr:alpha/beta hydrolase [Tetrasphaera sp. F2B08]
MGGHRLHLYCTGEGERTVLLEAGLGDWSLYLRGLQDELATTTRVCTYDRAGYGWSEPGPMPRTGAQIVTEFEALLEATGESGPYVLAGHSFGGLTTLLFAEDHLEEVAGVVLIDSSHPRQEEAFADVPAYVAAQKDLDAQFESIAARVEAGQVGPVEVLPLAPGWLPLQLKYQWAAQFAQPHSMQAAIAEHDAWDQTMAQVPGRGSLGDLPLIVIAAGLGVGETDPGNPLTGDEAERINSIRRSLQEDHLTRSSNARLIVAENSGHTVYVDEPELVLDAIRALATPK